MTPERFQDEDFRADLTGTRVALFVVDEAHCVSEWGHSFRPSYLALAGAAEQLGRPSYLALTATATPWIRKEISDRLGLRDPDLTEEAEVDLPFALGDRVVHESLGEGVVQRVTGDSLTILFDKAGYKTPAAAVVQENRLLKPAE